MYKIFLNSFNSGFRVPREPVEVHRNCIEKLDLMDQVNAVMQLTLTFHIGILNEFHTIQIAHLRYQLLLSKNASTNFVFGYSRRSKKI